MDHRLSSGLVISASANSQQLGAVDTAFKLIGPDGKIVVDAYGDPGVAGVTCYVPRAKPGGIQGAISHGTFTLNAEITTALTMRRPLAALKK